MSTSAGTAVQDVDRKVLYSIHYAPTDDGLPKIRRFWLIGPARNLYAIMTVDGERKRCDLSKERSLEFIAAHAADVRIELYVERLRGDILVASKECSLESLASLDTRVRLDVCDSRIAKRPELQLSATVTPFHESLAAEVAAMKPSLSISDKWSAILGYSRSIIQICTALGETIPLSQTIFALLDLGVDELEKRMEYHQVIAALVDETSRVCEVVVASDKREFKDKRREQGKACHVLTAELLRVSSFLRSLATKDLVERSRTEVNERVQDMLKRLQELSRYVESGAHVDTQDAVFRIEEKIDNENTLRRLPMANTQAGTSKGCLPNTRVQLLASVMDWVFDPKGPRCLIIHGAAGKGKSAVANSVARILADMGAIAPFFAFDRTNPTRHAHQLYPTLAEKLAVMTRTSFPLHTCPSVDP